MGYSPGEIERLRSVFKKYKYFPVDSLFKLELLYELNLYRKVTLNGKSSYVLFHKKGSPFSGKVPGRLYVAEEDMDYFLEIAKSVNPKPASAAYSVVSATILETTTYAKEVLDNDSLDNGQKIKLTLQFAGEIMENVFEQSDINAEQLNNIKHVGENLYQFIQKVVRSGNEESQLLDRLIGYDYYTYSHCIHVSLYAGIVASEMVEQGLDIKESLLPALSLGALLHDIGKIRINREIINKTGRLTQAEFEEIKKHPQQGVLIMKAASVHPDVICVIEQHQERWNGGGYPANLRGDQIAPISRIACICDVFDALTTNRTYRPALLPFDALSLMLHAMEDNFYPPYLKFFIQFLGQKVR